MLGSQTRLALVGKITNSVVVNEGGNTTSDLDTALTRARQARLPLSLDMERDLKWTGIRNQKNKSIANRIKRLERSRRQEREEEARPHPHSRCSCGLLGTHLADSLARLRCAPPSVPGQGEGLERIHLPFSLERGRVVAAVEAGVSLNSFGSASRRSWARVLRTRSRYSRRRAS
jgi:hypothetical protein